MTNEITQNNNNINNEKDNNNTKTKFSTMEEGY